jgi:hypothetical protein
MAQPTIPEAIPEAEPAKLKPNGPRLRPDGSMMLPSEAFAAAAGQQQQDEIAKLGQPLFLQKKASKRP